MGLWWAFNEVQICRIFPKRAIIGLILHRNRKRRFYVVFKNAVENREKIGARIGLILLILSIGSRKGINSAIWIDIKNYFG